ncbi:DegT/DnrJ/EryC1/StrS family aminotransferase [Kytococcus sedentarius]|uniref:DegT/DnrJ/EryC1/StrS family aminotransferase n=1 Tax=Kytococcus sedentarius TaxID=1276 RepID=UPI0035BC34B6
MSERIHLSMADISDAEEQAVVRAIRSGWVAPLGPEVDAFEAEIAERVGVGHALALSSGTAALHLALVHLGAKPGTHVVTSSMTFAATANAIAYTGATPVFVDAQESDANVDPELMLQAVRDLQGRGEQVVAAVPVDLFGRACDYDVLEPGLAELGVPLLCDAAESLGARLGDRAAGSFGTASAFSFNGNKIMTTSGGGMLVSDDEALIAHARKLSTQAREPVPWYEHTEYGYNYRLSNILAAIGRAQLGRLDELIGRRRAVRERYVEAFDGLEGVRVLGTGEDAHFDNCWLTSLVVDRPGYDVDAVQASLAEQGIEARHLWKPMHLQPVFAGAPMVGGEVSEKLFRTGLNLPSSSTMTDEQQERVIAALLPLIDA